MRKSLIRSRNRDKHKPKENLFALVFGSHVANMIILLNCAAYYYTHYHVSDTEAIAPFVLYPGSLLQGRLWTVITAGFIHQDLSHLLLNMLGILIFARIVERKLGFFKTLFIYLGALGVSMLCATGIYAFWLHKNVVIIGASGALMGLISAAMLLDPFRVTYEMIIPLPVMVKAWIFLYMDVGGLLSGEIDGVSHIAHLCGFLSIAVLMYFLSSQDQRLMRVGLLINIVSFLLFVIIGAWLVDTF
jgi:membrane associated rhomboid family serine protease